ncbi:MAG: HAMP domain-containing protein [Pedobacter sp.]|nr:MAG: HAMP domain-containing protein [Pedobacter sp.]
MLLGICCIATALSLDNSITQTDLLLHEAENLQQNLASKEKIVQSYLSNNDKLNELKAFKKNEQLSLNFINTYRDNGINVLVYKNLVLDFWSSSRAFPQNINRLKEGASFQQLPNGYYEVIKKTSGAYVIIFLISVKTQFGIENQFLKNRIVPELFPSNSLDLATFTDKDTKEIFTINKEYLFPVKLSEEYSKNIYTTVQLWLWIVGLFSICLFVNSYCSWLAKKGFLFSATLILSVFFVAFRLTDLQFFWFNHQFNLEIFSPSIYAESEFLPSLGDLLLHVISLTWIVLFIYVHRYEYALPKWVVENKLAGILIHAFLLLITASIAFVIDDVFFGLINNSKINFDITNIINLGWISWISILILCLVWFLVFLFVNIFIEVTKQFKVSNKSRLVLFLVMLIGYFIYKLSTDFNVFFLVYALFLFVIGWNNYIQHRKFSIGVYAILFLCIAFLTSLKYTKFIDIKERNNRKGIAIKLENTDDPKVINSINSFELHIPTDSVVVNYFKNPESIKTFSFHNYITKKYLDGYLSRFEYKIFEYNNQDSVLKKEESVPISKYKNLVLSGAFKTAETTYSYRINDTFGYQDYFGIIPIFDDKNLLGTLVIDLKSQSFDYNSHFPELLIEGKLKSDEDLSEYSFAFYKDNKLSIQSGKFTYPMINTVFKGAVDKVEFINESVQDVDYNHAVYKPDNAKIIVITKEKMPYVVRLATLSFFFLVFIIFGIVVYILLWFLKNMNSNKAGWFSINRYLMINANKILYKTRIQFSVVLSVVATLLIVGWTTFSYIKEEYLKQQKDSIREKVRKIQLLYEKQILNTDMISTDDQAEFDFNQFADINAAYLNLYDTNGDLKLTSLRKMYDYGIMGKKMGPVAFINLSLMQRSEFLNPTERIGSFTYAAAYAPIRNAQNKTIAYIGLPYYANEADYQAKIGLFINTLINIYALVFVLIGVLAVFLANQITNPLTFIQESIKRTKLGQKNQPIIWHRQDEIGLLIKEYNKMIAALEVSASKLARSERESAWREMAKQVAHEIKNPLTPLKLGVQLLEKSWKENDPNFEKKFASFNRSFIEQIDSLATIASEFSNFAKMPDTKLENLELLPVIEQAIAVFNSSDNVEIIVLNRTNKKVMVLGDKDQLLRTFNNLLKNAIEASESKATCAIKIRIINDEKQVYVEVEDNGKGIDTSLQDKIFVPNFTTKSSGTGLGLAFVKQAIENAGGTIDFTSLANQGTIFYLTFPLV